MRRPRGRRPAAHSDDTLERQVREVIALTFDLDEDALPTPASNETIPDWTTSGHMTLLLNLEQRFGVSFSLEQMVSMTSGDSVVEVLRELTGSGPPR